MPFWEVQLNFELAVELVWFVLFLFVLFLYCFVFKVLVYDHRLLFCHILSGRCPLFLADLSSCNMTDTG